MISNEDKLAISL